MKRLFASLVLLLAVLGIALAVIAAEGGQAPPLGADVAAAVMAALPESVEGWVTLAVTVCAALSALIPRPADDAHIVWRAVYGLINAVGFNVLRARNASAVRGAFPRLGKR